MKRFKELIRLSSFDLKLIAAVTMLIDHVGYVFFPEIPELRMIGRLAFPIYCFLLTEGFAHTRNKWKYAMRLGIFALVSEVPFDIALKGKMVECNSQNVFFTLFLGLVAIILFDTLKEYNYVGMIGGGVCVVACGMVAEYLQTDYYWYGVALIFLFYVSRPHFKMQTASLVGLNSLFAEFFVSSLQHIASLAIIPISLYNGKKGRFSLKYFFYAFYPVHLLVIGLIRNYTEVIAFVDRLLNSMVI